MRRPAEKTPATHMSLWPPAALRNTHRPAPTLLVRARSPGRLNALPIATSLLLAGRRREAAPRWRLRLFQSLRLLGSLYTYVGFVRCWDGAPRPKIEPSAARARPLLSDTYTRVYVCPLSPRTRRLRTGRVPRALVPALRALKTSLHSRSLHAASRAPRIDLPAQVTRLHLV